jgi:hypothetical protein
VVINKADIDANAAMRAQAQITSSLRLLSQHGNPEHAHHDQTQWHPQVVQISALQGQGIAAFWAAVTQYRDLQTANGRLAARREKQALAWMWERIEAGLKHAFRQHPQVRALLPRMQQDVTAGRIAASTAARNLLAAQYGQAQSAIKSIAKQPPPKFTQKDEPCKTSWTNWRKSARWPAWAAGKSASTPSTRKASSPRASASSCCWTTARSRNGTCSSSTAAPTSAWKATRSLATAW